MLPHLGGCKWANVVPIRPGSVGSLSLGLLALGVGLGVAVLPGGAASACCGARLPSVVLLRLPLLTLVVGSVGGHAKLLGGFMACCLGREQPLQVSLCPKLVRHALANGQSEKRHRHAGFPSIPLLRRTARCGPYKAPCNRKSRI